MTTRMFRIGAGVTLLAGSSLALTACGGPPNFDEVWPQTYENVENAESVSIAFEGTNVESDETMSATFSGQLDDSNYEGHMSLGDIEYEVKTADGRTVMTANDAFYQESDSQALAELVGDSWFEAPSSDDFTISSFFDSLTSDLDQDPTDEGEELEVEEVEEDGQNAYKYSGTADGDDLAITVTENNELLRMEANTDELDGTVEFSNWNAVEPIEFPADEEIVTLPGN